MSQLPLYHKNTKYKRSSSAGGSFKLSEAHLLMFLFLTFTLAWCVLVVYMPESQTSDTGFEATYQKFIHRSLESSPSEDIPAPPKILLPDDPQSNPVHVTTPTSKKTPETVKTPLTDSPTLSTSSTNREPDLGMSDQVTIKRREKVKEMIKLAWDGYSAYALGENELKPMSKVGHSAAIFGKTKLGATIVDSLDTLYIAGLMEEFNQAKKWVEESFNINEIDSPVSFFEFNIRFIGGFLSAYALSGDEVFKLKAVSLADKLMPVFQDNGIPSSFVNMKTGATRNWGWAKSSSVLSEIGSLHLEYQYLTHLTDNTKYFRKVDRIRKILKGLPSSDGMYYTLINQKSMKFGNKVSSLGALGDSFYEYLLKSWLITSKQDIEAKEMYYEAIDALENKMLIRKNKDVLMATDYKNSRSDQSMQHLACFSGGMYALGAVHAENGKGPHYMEIGKNLTYTCRRSYDTTATKLGPERFRVNDQLSFSSRANSDKMYLLRPETVESYFILWRLTHDPKYREWGWDLVQALEKHCRTPHGYSGIKDVYQDPPVKDDVQQSFFIAETLKYLYLLFSDDSVIPLDKWVFNTEAHPLPVMDGVPSTDRSN